MNKSYGATLIDYYSSLESRIGYRLLLGGTRHYGYWDNDTYWPFPVGASLRKMEEKLFTVLNVAKGGRVLDAGCGVGHVAMYMARKGLFVEAIDITPRHVTSARRNIQNAGLVDSIKVNVGDYHKLEYPDQSFEGVYTMETFVHAHNPARALQEMLRVLKPGGHLAMHEYDHKDMDKEPHDDREDMALINKHASMPANMEEGALYELLVDAGFEHIVVRNYLPNIMPMLRLFYVIAYIPLLIFTFLGWKHLFVNTVAGVAGYRGRDSWRYIAISANKPRS